MAADKGFVIELIRWETHLLPAMGRPQQVVMDQIGPYDVLIGIMWKRFGTPTGKAQSGTEEEFDAAYHSWEQTGRPYILFYFNETSYTIENLDACDQLRKVLGFRARIQGLGLVQPYRGAESFGALVHEHLTRLLGTFNLSVPPPQPTRRIDAAQELLDSAHAEWVRHGVFASYDRLELFRVRVQRLSVDADKLRFIVASACKLRRYDPLPQLVPFGDQAVRDIAVSLLVQAIDKPDSADLDITYGAIRLVASFPSAHSASVLTDIIRSGLPADTRDAAVQAFHFGPVREVLAPQTLAVLIDTLASESNWRLRKSAAYALREIRSEEVRTALERALLDPRSMVRSDAVQSLASLGYVSSIPPIVGLLNRERGNRSMQRRIAWALSRFRGDASAIDAVTRLATSKDPLVAETAATIAGWMTAT